MGIVYRGNFKQISGLIHPKTNITTTLTPVPNTSWFGRAQNIAVSNTGLLAVGVLQDGAIVAGTNYPSSQGFVYIMQVDGSGTIANVADIIDPRLGSLGSKWIPLGMSFSPDGNYLVIHWQYTANGQAAGAFTYQTAFYQISANALTVWNTVTSNNYSVWDANSFVWHSNSTNFAIYDKVSSKMVIGDVGNAYTAMTPIIQKPRTTTWLGNDLLVSYDDPSQNYAPRWSIFSKTGSGASIASTTIKTGFVLNNNMSRISAAIAASATRLIAVNSGNSGAMVYDYAYNGNGNFTSRVASSFAASVYVPTYISYSSVGKRLIVGNSIGTNIFGESTGNFNSVNTSKFSATNNVVGLVQDPNSGDAIVLGEYDITTYSIPTGVGFSATNSKQLPLSTMFSWDFSSRDANFTPTIDTGVDAQTAIVVGSPTMAAAPGKSGKYAAYFNNAGTDKIVWPKSRDFQFMYKRFTLEFYMYYISGQGYVLGDGKNFGFSRIGSNMFGFGFIGGSGVQANISENTWAHVAITMDGLAGDQPMPSMNATNTLKMFVNGIPAASSYSVKYAGYDINPIYPSNLHWGYFSMGGSVNYTDGTAPTTPSGFKGYLHQVKLYNYAKYTSMFTPPAF